MMTKPPQDEFFSCVPDSTAPVHRFSHEAMATVFEVFIIYEDANYAHQAAWAAFDELDKIEQNLSRFIENSDISQINRLAAGQSLKLGDDAFRCLQLSAEVYDRTNGAFDITVGSLLDHGLAQDGKPSVQEADSTCYHTGMTILQLDETEYTVTLLAGPVQIDLGGVGKGYAVDRMAELLADWSIDTALICAGQSSVLALGAPPQSKGWPVKLTNPHNHKEVLARLFLWDEALSGSGLQKGPHIIDPGTALPVTDKCAAWASAPDAAGADALSTAFMVMSIREIEDYCLHHLDTQAMIILKGKDTTQQERILQYGHRQTDIRGS
jgi:thiamine biosynthesis lipoprotein